MWSQGGGNFGVFTLRGAMERKWTVPGAGGHGQLYWTLDGKWIVGLKVLEKNNTLLWTPAGEPGPKLDQPYLAHCAALSPDGRLLATAGANTADTPIRLYNTSTWQVE